VKLNSIARTRYTVGTSGALDTSVADIGANSRRQACDTISRFYAELTMSRTADDR